MSLQTVRTYSTPWEAGMAKSVLDADGIPAIADDPTLNGVLGTFYSGNPAGYRVLVDDANLESAAATLREWEESAGELPESEDTHLDEGENEPEEAEDLPPEQDDEEDAPASPKD